MKLSGLQENLKQGLFFVNHIANKNINLPILNNVLIRAQENNIEFVSTNLEIGITCNIRGKVEKPGVFTVDSKLITEYINLLPNKKVDIELKDNDLVVSSENYKTKIRGLSAEEFPLIPQVDKDNYFTADLEVFKKALSSVVFSASASDTRLELTGVLFIFKDKQLVLAATDSYRLAEKKIDVSSGGSNKGDFKIIVPARTIQELVRIISGMSNQDLGGDTKKEIKFYISENQIMFACGPIELVSRLIEGQYPDYEQIIPTKSRTNALVSRQELMRAVKAASLFSKSGINDINLDFPNGKNKVVVSSISGQTGENISEIEAEVNGEDNGVVVNFRYLLDGLNNIDSDNLKIEIIDGNTPCILKPEKEKDCLYIIMPIKQ